MAVVFRPLSAAAARFKRRASDLAAQVAKGGVLNRIYEIFIIRAQHAGPNQIATVIEVPVYFVGGYGGQNGATDYYTPFVTVDFGPSLDAIIRTTIRLDEIGNPIPNIPTDKYKGRAFSGSGRVVIGDVPAWEDYRQALNNTTGVYSAGRSAVMVATLPSLTVETAGNRPWLRSLVVCRANGESGTAPVTEFDGGTTTGVIPADVLTGHVMMTPTPPTGAANRISGFEMASAELGISGAHELVFAGAAIEWGPLRGLVAVEYRTLDMDDVTTGNGMCFVAYQITDNGIEAITQYTGEVLSVGVVDVATVPGADAPTALSAVAAADPSFTYPSWSSNTTVAGRDASAGRLLMRDPNLYARLFSSGMGYTAGVDQGAITLVEVQSDIEAPGVSVRGYQLTDPVTFNTVNVPAKAATKWVTYVAAISPLGVVTLVKLAEFLDSRYETGGSLIRKQVQTFGGCSTRPTELAPFGEARLFCTEWDVRYEVLPADPDGPSPTLIQGEPARRVLVDGSAYVRLADLAFYLIDDAGIKTPLALGAYFPALFNINTSTYNATFSGRLNFGNSALRVTNPRIGNDFPLIQCQFAPGVIAVVVSPTSGYADPTQVLRVALFDVATGGMLALSPAILGLALPARVSISCFEQGTVDVDGNLLTYGRLLIGASTLSAASNRTDGWFILTGLQDITWLAREPSNTAPFYVGNQLVPADLGVTTNLSYTKPTAVPAP